MKITKMGHCCLLLEIEGKRILTDPGRFSDGQNALLNIDIILITHEHPDHFHTASINAILDNNPTAEVITNSSVGRLLTELGVVFNTLEGREERECSGLMIKAYDGKHVEIFEDFGIVQNTGYAVNNGTFFFPGDAYTVPEEKIKVLAAPVAGPWCKVVEAINYILEVSPEVALPVHDATLSEVGKSITYPHFTRELEKHGSKFVPLEIGVEMDF